MIQLVRYAYHKNDQLVSLIKGYSQRFSLYCGQAQRELTEEQKEIMKQIADYIVEEGSISTNVIWCKLSVFSNQFILQLRKH